MSRFSLPLLTFVLFFIHCQSVGAQTLKELVSKTTQRFERVYATDPNYVQETVEKVNHWLQGPITLQAFALKSDLRNGNDEIEAGILFPFRSPQGRNLDSQQMAITQSLSALREKRLALVVSGLVREALWKRRVAQERLYGLQQKAQWISRFDTLIETLYKQNEISHLVYLQWQQKKLEHQLLEIKAKHTAKQAREYYIQVTGVESLPDDYSEQLIESPIQAVSHHPELRLLSISQSQVDLSLNMSGNASTPWTLGMIARQLRGPVGNENLLGMYVNIPLSSGNRFSVNNYAAWQEARAALTELTIDTYSKLQQQISTALSDYNYLNNAAPIIDKQVEIADEIEQHYMEQQAVLPQVLWLDKLIEQQDLRIAKMMNKVERAEAVAKVNQIAGVVL